jgi:hypothetical protein
VSFIAQPPADLELEKNRRKKENILVYNDAMVVDATKPFY